MVENNSFVKLYRKFEQWEWYTDVNVKTLFIHCLIKANWEDKRWRGIEVKRGSFITSISNLSKETGLSPQKVRNAIFKLESTHELTRSTTSKYTILTVLKYNVYQETNKQNNKQTTNKQQTNNKQTTTTKELKEYKEIKELKNKTYSHSKNEVELIQNRFNTFWNLYPKKIAKNDCLSLFTSICVIDNSFNEDKYNQLMDGLNNHIEYRFKSIDSRFIPYPKNWLKNEEWENKYKEPKLENTKLTKIETPSWFSNNENTSSEFEDWLNGKD